MTIPLDDLRAHVAAALQHAAFGYGADLLLSVPAPLPGSAPAPTAPAEPTPGRSAPTTTAAPRPTTPGRPANRAATPAALRAEAPAATAVPPPAGDVAAADPLQVLRAEALACKKCKLCETRRSVVFGEGNPRPDVLFVGEAPGAVEDQTGRPFVGPAGQLLDRILDGAMGLRREEVFIANVNKCRPPGNRDPEPEEVAACLPYLRRQVELLQPKVMVALGRIAAHNLLETTAPMRELRGKELHYAGIPLVVTWHPAYLLRDPSRKAETWADIKRVNRLLGRPEDPRRATPPGA